MFTTFFSKIQCSSFIEIENYLNINEVNSLLSSKIESLKSTVDGDVENEIIRKSKNYILNMNVNFNLIQKLENTIDFLNNTNWRFKINSIKEFSIIEYEKENFYDWHYDFGFSPTCCNRKLTILIQLSDENSYSGGEMKINLGGDVFHTFSKKVGTLLVFPTFYLHKAFPIIEGNREVFISWVHGDSFV